MSLAWDSELFTIFAVDPPLCKCTMGNEAKVCKLHRKAMKLTVK